MSFPRALSVALAWWGASAGLAAGLDPPAQPVEVRVGIYVIDLISIDGASQTFTADLAVGVSWQDPRLADPDRALRKLPLEQVWHPRLLITNSRETKPTRPEVVEVESDGRVTYRQRFVGTFACPLDLRRFPRDTQRLFIQIVAQGYRPDEVEFVIDESRSGSSDSLAITDWKIGTFKLEAAPFDVPQVDVLLPGVVLDVSAQRLTRYYVGTIYATVGIIGSMAWLVFWLPLGAIAPRVSVSVTSMLAMIAYRFVAAKDLPRLPYLTRMDFFLLGSAFLMLLGLVGVVAIARCDAADKPDAARRLNQAFRWIYALTLGGLILAFS